MSRIAAEDALKLLEKWSEEGRAIEVLPSQGQRAASVAILNRVLPQSQKAMVTLRDENEEAVAVTVSLEGAEWEYVDASGGTPLPELAEIKWWRFLSATFPNGNRCVFGERAEGHGV